MSQIDPGASDATPGADPGAQVRALPLRTIPHLVPAGATSPIPSVLVDAVRTPYTWTPPVSARRPFVWRRPDGPSAA